MDIRSIVEKYKKDDPELFEYIGNLVSRKAVEGKWDKGIEGESEDLTQMLLFEYSTAIEKITKGKIPAKFVVDKLDSMMGKMRYGSYKKGLDDEVLYDGMPVTSSKYTESTRYKSNFGAHAPTYTEDGKEKCAIVLFDNRDTFEVDGKRVALSGIDLTNLSDIRGTTFHEWTHIMEKSLVKASDLSREDIILEEGDSTYINSCISADLSMDEYKEYIASVDSLLNSDNEILFGGISTIEINERISPNRRIMHNQISEGATEFIARLVTKEVGDEVLDKTRYSDKVEFVERYFNSIGIDNAVATYVTDSRAMIRDLENRKINGRSLLHESSRHLDFLGNVERGLSSELRYKGASMQDVNDIKSSLMEFWSLHPDATNEDVGIAFNKILDTVPVDLSRAARRTILDTLRYPSVDKRFKKELDKQFPQKEEKPKIAENVIEGARKIAEGRKTRDLKDISNKIKSGLMEKEKRGEKEGEAEEL